MARGTKTYTTGKVRSIRTGAIVYTYSNVDPAGTFQTGDNIFQLQYFPPETNSPDCVDPDTTPDSFTFTPTTNSNISTLHTSNIVYITGLGFDNVVPVTVTGFEYRKNGAGSWLTSPGTAQNGDYFELRGTSSSSYVTPVSGSLTVGGVSSTYTITTKVAPAVVVNYDFLKGDNPTPDIVLVPIKNGDNINNIYGTATGTFASTFAGNVMAIYLVHQLAYMPWPEDSSASLVIKKDGVNIYNSGVITDEDQELIGYYTWTLEEGSEYDIIAVSDSTSTLYTGQNINWDDQTGQALNNVIYEFEDADQPSEPFIMHTAQPVTPLNNVAINWLTGAGLGRLDITINDSGLDLNINLSNTTFGGGYNTTIVVPAGGTGFFANIPKTSYLITVTVDAL